jgi:hypothetical protein
MQLKRISNAVVEKAVEGIAKAYYIARISMAILRLLN